jgi:hypothetical protein
MTDETIQLSGPSVKANRAKPEPTNQNPKADVLSILIWSFFGVWKFGVWDFQILTEPPRLSQLRFNHRP